MTRGKISSATVKNTCCLLHKTARYCRQSPSTRAHAGAAPSSSTVTRYENTSASAPFAGLLTLTRQHTQGARGHGVLGEGTCPRPPGDDAAEGLQGDGRDDGEGGEEEEHRGAEAGEVARTEKPSPWGPSWRREHRHQRGGKAWARRWTGGRWRGSWSWEVLGHGHVLLGLEVGAEEAARGGGGLRLRR